MSTKLCAFGSGVKDCKLTILLMFGMDPSNIFNKLVVSKRLLAAIHDEN